MNSVHTELSQNAGSSLDLVCASMQANKLTGHRQTLTQSTRLRIHHLHKLDQLGALAAGQEARELRAARAAHCRKDSSRRVLLACKVGEPHAESSDADGLQAGGIISI